MYIRPSDSWRVPTKRGVSLLTWFLVGFISTGMEHLSDVLSTTPPPANHSHHCHQGHTMAMVFHGGYREAILFDFWTIDSIHGLVMSCILVFIASALNEIFKFQRMRLSAKYYEQRKSDCGYPGDGRFIQDLVIATLGCIQTAVGLLIMLVTMTFNSYLFISAIVGVLIGQIYVSYKQPLVYYSEDACH